jgi:hypothetical protein
MAVAGVLRIAAGGSGEQADWKSPATSTAAAHRRSRHLSIFGSIAPHYNATTLQI